MSSSFLADANGTREAFGTTGGIRSLRLFSEKGDTPRLRSFMQHAYTDEPKALADELNTIHGTEPSIEEMCRTLEKHAAAADEILMLTCEEERQGEGGPRGSISEEAVETRSVASAVSEKTPVSGMTDEKLRAAFQKKPEEIVLSVEDFLDLAENGEYVQHVERNASRLQDLGVFEEFFIEAYRRNKLNLHDVPADMLSRLFEAADPAKLRSAGQRAPGPGPFTLYRGVSGVESEQYVRGFSWTGTIDVAGVQALLLGLPNPAVYRVVVPESCVLTYVLGEEDEYLIRLTPSVRPEPVPESEWRPAAEKHVAEVIAKNETRRHDVRGGAGRKGASADDRRRERQDPAARRRDHVRDCVAGERPSRPS